MKKLQIIIIASVLLLSICAFASMQAKAAILDPTVPPPLLSPSGSTTVGTLVTLSVTIPSNDSIIPTGTVAFQFEIGSGSYFNISSENLNNAGFASTIYTPSSAGSYQFQVDYSGDGTFNPANSTSPAPLTVNPVLTVSVGPSSVNLDETQLQVFTAAASGGSGGYTYKWYLNSIQVSGQTGSTYSFSASAVGSDSVYAVISDSDSVSATSNTASITVNSALAVPTVSASASSVDRGQTSTLNSTAVSTGTSPYTYQWLDKAPGGSFVDVGTNSASYSFVTSGSTATGSWSFELQVTDASSINVTSNAVSVTVNIAPTVSMSPSSWTMDVGQSKMFTANPTGGSGSYPSSGYQWYVGGAPQSGQTASTFNYLANSAGSPLITVTVTDSLGVTSVPSSAPSVTVSVSPTVSIAPVGPVALDIGQIQVFTATTIGGSGSLSYSWYLDGVAAGSNSASYSYTASGSSHSITCKVTDSASTPIPPPTSNSVSVSVNAGLAVGLSPSSWTMDVNQNEVFNASAIGGSGGYTYKWYLNSILVSGQTSSTYTFTASAAGSNSVYVVVTDSASISATSNKATVTVSASLAVSITPVGPLILDAGQAQTFTAKATGGSGTISYQWYEDVTKVGTNSASYSFTAAGSLHSINCTVTDSASTQVTLSSNDVSVTVNSAFGLPIVSASANAVDQGQTSTLSSTAVSGGTGPYTYQWLWQAPNGSSPSPISGATSTSYSFVASSSTTTGSWSFELQVNDSISQMVISDPVTIAVSASPTVSIAPVGPLTLDVGQVQVFTATPSGGSGSLSYQWYEDVTKVGTNSASYSFTAAGSSHSITCQVTDSATVPIAFTSNVVSITVNSTNSNSTATPTPTSTTTSTPTATPKPNTTPTPTPTEYIAAKTSSGAKVEIGISGNITSSQMTNIAIATNQSATTTTVSFTVTGVSGTTGFSNITIPKSSVPYGTTPTIYIDGQTAQNQGYTRDSNNYYVWYTTHFSTHQVSIQFSTPLASKGNSISPLLVVGLTVPEIILIYTVVAFKRLKRKPDEA